MVIRRLDEVEIMETAHKVDARNLYDTADAVITVITLQPGQALKRHEVSAGVLVESPRDIVHCW